MQVLIPVWNDVATIGAVVAGAARFAPVWVVDDGSTDGSGDAAAAAGARVIRAAHAGKGAALRRGLEHARAENQTHVLTLDADGQHITDDLPALIAASREQPDALVLGVRPIHAGPLRSRLGRQVSNQLVRWHGGQAVSDSQCGLRVYPLRSASRWMSAADGYEFELETVFMAAKAKIPLVEVPCQVRYPGPRRLGWTAAAHILWRGLRGG